MTTMQISNGTNIGSPTLATTVNIGEQQINEPESKNQKPEQLHQMKHWRHKPIETTAENDGLVIADHQQHPRANQYRLVSQDVGNETIVGFSQTCHTSAPQQKNCKVPQSVIQHHHQQQHMPNGSNYKSNRTCRISAIRRNKVSYRSN